MATAYEIAIAHYEEAFALFARRAGVSPPAGAPALSAFSRRAEALALGGVSAAAPAAGAAIPQLAALGGRLLGARQRGFYAPAAIGGARVLPQRSPPADLSRLYADLWREYTTARARTLHAAQPPALREANLHALLQRYAWAMAAPHAAASHAAASHAAVETDISLFDATRVAAALAICLEESGGQEEPLGVLIGGDLSGVQDWLYTFGSSGAAKSLRGRSVYLQLLAEVIAQYVLDALELPQAALLYAGGGNFYLLAPLRAAQALDSIRRTLAERLLAMHQGALTVALESTPVSARTLEGGGIGALWGALHQRLGQRKQQRFAELDDAAMARALGRALEHSGSPDDSCRVCRRTLLPDEEGAAVDDAQGGRKCDLCLSFEELGSALRTADRLVVSTIAPLKSAPVQRWEEGLRQLGFDVRLLQPHKAIAPSGKRTVIYTWHEELPRGGVRLGDGGAAQTVWAYRPLAQCVPLTASGEIADFAQLESDGIARWGVLRMDVDHLGQIFQRGLPGDSLARVVGLSGLLRLFFEGYVPQLADRLNAGKPRLYLMYAGGDDLFVVGGWSHLPGLAWEIRTALRAFCVDNPHVTVSGGMSIALGEKYPLYQAARDAGAAEHRAKDAGRNAFTLLGQALPWEEEGSRVSFAAAQERAAQMRAWLSEGTRVPRSLLSTLRSIDAEWRAWKRQEGGAHARYARSKTKLFVGPWQWHLVYSLTRAAERTHDTDLQRDLARYVESIIAGEIETVGLVARWVELWTRTP